MHSALFGTMPRPTALSTAKLAVMAALYLWIGSRVALPRFWIYGAIWLSLAVYLSWAADPTLFWVEPERRGVIPLDGFRISSRLARTVRSDASSLTASVPV